MDNLDRMYRHLVRTVRSRFPQYLTQPFDVAELYQTILPYRHHRRELGLETNDDYETTLTELLSGARDYLIVDEDVRRVLKAELAANNPDPSAFKQFAKSRVALSPSALRSLDAGPSVAAGASDIDLPFVASARDGVTQPASSITAEQRARPSGARPSEARSSEMRPAEARSAERRAAEPRTAEPRPAAAAAATSTLPSSGTPPSVVNPGRPSSGAAMPGTGSIVPVAGERCRSCDGLLPEGRAITFCPHCGQNLTTMNCPACGSELELGWSFCPTCGRPTQAR